VPSRFAMGWLAGPGIGKSDGRFAEG
jgi:hypothetical protein